MSDLVIALVVGVVGALVWWRLPWFQRIQQRQWACVLARHHYHNLGPVETGRCGMPLRYEWQCCVCGRRGRTPYKYSGPGTCSVSVSEHDEREHARADGR